jgi:hypothetical protein
VVGGHAVGPRIPDVVQQLRGEEDCQCRVVEVRGPSEADVERTGPLQPLTQGLESGRYWAVVVIVGLGGGWLGWVLCHRYGCVGVAEFGGVVGSVAGADALPRGRDADVDAE